MQNSWSPLQDHRRFLNALGLSEGCTYEQCKAAHKQLLLKWHPDRFPQGDPRREKAASKIKEINSAFDRLRKQRFTGPIIDVHKSKEQERETKRVAKLTRMPTTVTRILA